MSELLSKFAVVYILLGVCANLFSGDRRIRFVARLVVLVAWPWLVCNEGTPAMARFIEWAKKD